MNQKKIEKFKEQFLQEKEKLLAETHKEVIEIDIDGDEVDAIQAEMIGLSVEKLSSKRLEKLSKIERALQRIKDGIFGECQECGIDIDEKRLAARPEASTCIKCAEKLEKLRKQFAR